MLTPPSDRDTSAADILPPPVDPSRGLAGPSGLSELVSRAAKGDAASWAAITDRFTALVRATARSSRLGTDESADVVQITWLRLLENLPRIPDPEALPGWLGATARREALDLLSRGSPASHVVWGLSGQ
jgi:DNA-directed RNA polymerase specialized sigma24 family protein